jgi:predicted DsbA family dithiol-disulfide isomerase
VRLAQRLALASPLVLADMVDASTWFELARRHRVRGVPTTVVNGRVAQVGGGTESQLQALVRRAIALPQA